MENQKIVSTYASILVLTILALFVVQKLNIGYPVTLTTMQKSAELSVVGEGKVEVVPDSTTIDVGVTVNNLKTAQETQKELTKINNQIIAAVAKLGIAKKDMQTNNYSVYPNYNYDNGQNNIIGYNGNAGLTIKTNKIELASQIASVATENGANEIRGTSFQIDKPEKYREEARNKAIENAKEQAAKLAKSLGIKLGKVTNIVESQGYTPQPIMYAEAKMIGAGGGGDTNLEPGSQTVTSTVTLYFEKR